MTNSKPIETFRRGSIEAAIWRNEGENGVSYNVTLKRTYRDGDDVKSSTSFGQYDLLKVARVADMAENFIFTQLE